MVTLYNLFQVMWPLSSCKLRDCTLLFFFSFFSATAVGWRKKLTHVSWVWRINSMRHLLKLQALSHCPFNVHWKFPQCEAILTLFRGETPSVGDQWPNVLMHHDSEQVEQKVHAEGSREPGLNPHSYPFQSEWASYWFLLVPPLHGVCYG